MSVRSATRALPTLLRVGFAEAVAYRAEMFVWVLATTMPLIMLAFWGSIARDAPIGRFDQSQFTAYFLATFVVRQLTGSWACYLINFEIRQGTLSTRLLRPIHPLIAFATEAIASIPMRVVISIPVAIISLVVVGSKTLPRDPIVWLVFVMALAGGWMLTFLANVAIGAIAFFIDSSLKVMDVWLAFFFVFSGYLIPTELFPKTARAIVEVSPFRFQIGFPVEVATGALDRGRALLLLGEQWAWVAAMLAITVWLWRRGVARFSAFGG